MKNSTRFVSAILAAILCGAAFSACANEINPPVTEVTTDITTDAPATIAPVTDVTTDAPTTEAPETTVTSEAPTTETTDIFTTTDAITTEGAETSDTPATSPSTTAAPSTDAPSVTTEAPVTTEAVSETTSPEKAETQTDSYTEYTEKLRRLLYVDFDGFVRIRGSSLFRLPANGYHLNFDATNTDDPNLHFVWFASSELQLTDGSASVPYKEFTFDGPHSCYAENGRIYVSYNNGETVVALPDEMSGEIYDCYVSQEISIVCTDGYRAIITNKGVTINVQESGKVFVYVEKNNTICLLGEPFNASGLKQQLAKSIDGGITYTSDTIRYEAINDPRVNGWSSSSNNYTDISGNYIPYQYTDFGAQFQLPIFDGDIGVLTATTRYNGKVYVSYFITEDRGESWFKFDPTVITSDSPEEIIISYQRNISR